MGTSLIERLAHPCFPERGRGKGYPAFPEPHPAFTRVSHIETSPSTDYSIILMVLQLKSEISELRQRVKQLEESPSSVSVLITALDPEPFFLTHHIPVVLTPEDDGYIATFFDAGISINGDNKEEAVNNLRLLIVDMFEELESQEDALGPYPQRQLAVLRSFLKKQS